MLVVEDNLNSDARALEATVTCPSICENSVQILCSSNQHDRDVHESNQTKIGVKMQVSTQNMWSPKLTVLDAMQMGVTTRSDK
jgi:hypothetical protein